MSFVILSEDKQYDHIKLAVLEVVGKHFRPEFINRIDEMVVFHPLAEEQIRGIAEIQLERLRGRLAERDLKLEMSEAAMEQLVVAGYDPVYGARPLKRAIQTGLENPLAHKILSAEFIAGDTILADVEHGNLVFHKKRLH
jgi:ATP-dependent Clp protease ATP-binding subunit ClpB